MGLGWAVPASSLHPLPRVQRRWWGAGLAGWGLSVCVSLFVGLSLTQCVCDTPGINFSWLRGGGRAQLKSSLCIWPMSLSCWPGQARSGLVCVAALQPTVLVEGSLGSVRVFVSLSTCAPEFRVWKGSLSTSCLEVPVDVSMQHRPWGGAPSSVPLPLRSLQAGWLAAHSPLCCSLSARSPARSSRGDGRRLHSCGRGGI